MYQELRAATEAALKRKEAERKAELDLAWAKAKSEVEEVSPRIKTLLMAQANDGKTTCPIHESLVKTTNLTAFMAQFKTINKVLVQYEQPYIIFDWSKS